jgi:hypothetical protein
MIKGVKQSAALYNIELEKINVADANKRFSQFLFPGNFEVLFEPEAGSPKSQYTEVTPVKL